MLPYTPECFMLDSIQDSVLLLQNKSVRFANQNFEKLVGYSRTELYGSNNFPFFTSESAQTFATIISNPFENGHTKMLYLNHKTKGQILIFVTLSKYEDNSSTFISCVFKHFPRDKEERYKWLEMFDEYSDIMAAALEYDEQENDLVHVFNSRKAMGMPMFKNLTDTTNWVIKDAGYSKEEMKSWIEGYKKLRYSKDAMKSEQCITIPSTGETAILSVVARYVGESKQKRPIYFQTITDVTHFRKMEQELERKTAEYTSLTNTNAMLKNFVDNAPVCMGIVELVDDDNDSINLFLNPATARLILGNPDPKEVIGLKATLLGINQEEIKKWNQYYRESQRTQSTITFETEMTTVDQVVMYVSSSVRHLAGSTFAYIIQNITPRRNLELELQRHKSELEDTVKHRTAALEEALQVKSRFLGIMSHEIRTPLSGIVGMITLLGDSNLPLDQRDNLHIAQVCCEQLLVVIEDILDITRMEENKLELTDSPFSLHRVIEESLEIVSFESGKKSLELLCDMDPGLQDFVSGDASRLRQIIVNLLSNSVKFSFHGEIVLYAASQEVGNGNVKIQFSVKDEGIGIDEESKKRIFEPFNVDTSTTRKHGGAGLGLCISKRLTELMGGRMWYESQESQGSIFYFTVILKLSDRSQVPGTSSFLDIEIEKDPVLQLKCRGKQILIVDSCKTLLRVLSSWLGLWGFVPVTCTSAAEALRMLRRADNQQYPIVLISNSESLEDINQMKDLRPVIIMGYEILDGTELLPFLKKPIRISTLRQQLVRFFLNYKEEENPPARRSSLPPLKILIAEDNIMNQRVIKKVLESIGYPDITIVNNGQEAVNMVKTVKFDVIIMDVMMPELGGIEATEMIRRNEEIVQPEIVGLTANAFSDNINRCLNAGMSKVLTKPIQREQLINVLADIANKVSKT